MPTDLRAACARVYHNSFAPGGSRADDKMRPVLVPRVLIVAALVASSATLLAQRGSVFTASRDHPAIQYGSRPSTDRVASLSEALRSGGATLRFEPGAGYLKALLAALEIPIESQVLVFSETSAEAERIKPDNPRALYFDDTVSVGWVRGGQTLEIAATDREQGVHFYTL